MQSIRYRLLFLGVLLGLVALGASRGGGTEADPPRYMVAPDAPGSVWRLDTESGVLEHCSLVGSGCDVVAPGPRN